MFDGFGGFVYYVNNKMTSVVEISFVDESTNEICVLKWLSLELQRKFTCLLQMYKIIFGLCDIDPHMFF